MCNLGVMVIMQQVKEIPMHMNVRNKNMVISWYFSGNKPEFSSFARTGNGDSGLIQKLVR